MAAKFEAIPTLTRCRCSGFWITSHRRRLSVCEMWKLQGFVPDKILPVGSSRAMGQLAGNAMTVPVVTHVLNSVLPKLFPQLSEAD